MKYKTGQPKGGVIDEVLASDHICGVSGTGLKSYPKLIEKPEDWDKYKSVGEMQSTGGAGETNTCTNHALMRIVQKFINYFYQKNLLSSETRKFLDDNGYIVDEICNLSESFSAVMSGTNPQVGNSLTQVCWSLNNDGCVPESKHIDDFTNDTTFWRYPSAEMRKLGKDFTKHFKLDFAWLFSGRTEYHEFMYNGLRDHLLEGQIYAAIPVCQPWNQSVVIYNGRTQSDHAVDIVNRLNPNISINDSYIPFEKELTNFYLINAAMKVVLNPLKPIIKFDIVSESKKFLTEKPLGLGWSVPEFGGYCTDVLKYTLNQEEIKTYMLIRENFSISQMTAEKPEWQEWIEKLKSFVINLTK